MDGFREEDYNVISNFVNFVTRNAQFRVDVKQSIELYNYLSKIQTNVLPKIEAHILEVGSVKQLKDNKNAKKT